MEYYIDIVFEDRLSEAVIERLLRESPGARIVRRIHARGSGYIKTNIRKFNSAAKFRPFFIVMDSDSEKCALRLLRQAIPENQHPHLFFRIAVHEIETWLLADHENFSRFLGINQKKVPKDPESIEDPKLCLLNLCRRAKRRPVQKDLLPAEFSTATQGPNYNNALIEFVRNQWDPNKAGKNSESLRRALLSVHRLAKTVRC